MVSRLRSAAAVVVGGGCGRARAHVGVSAPAEARSQPRQPGPRMKTRISYKPVTFAEVPSWEQDDHAAAFKAFRKSCERVVAAARERAAADKAAACAALRPWSRPARRPAGTPAPSPRRRAKAFFEQHFTPNAVVHSGPQGLLTGYYEPLLEGSRTPQGAFQTPIYKRPPDLVNLVDETQRGAVGMALDARPQDRQGRRALRHPRADRAGRAQGQEPGARVSCRPGRGVLPADPGLGPRQAAPTAASCASTTTARTAIPTARSAAT